MWPVKRVSSTAHYSHGIDSSIIIRRHPCHVKSCPLKCIHQGQLSPFPGALVAAMGLLKAQSFQRSEMYSSCSIHPSRKSNLTHTQTHICVHTQNPKKRKETNQDCAQCRPAHQRVLLKTGHFQDNKTFRVLFLSSLGDVGQFVLPVVFSS